ncbi:hypothetical protein ANCCEY_12943 [Ancylostoma ceylanicum]|uniref:Reverse transcriptase domain-containing protein n=1 Tax=Ancylostoma ceylanicum TaxID=53326 RepID=A0A0D6L8L8_9BILA|nr:hypothetical protein ANCCEY_12943 [Ancylostoma ceylanicum]
MVNDINVAGLKIGSEMNMSKTQLMRVDSYVYLVRVLNMRNNNAPEITRRRRAGSAAFGSIREVTDQIKDPALRASIFNASVLPAMCYAAETWPGNETIAKAMRTTRRALGRLKTFQYQQ